MTQNYLILCSITLTRLNKIKLSLHILNISILISVTSSLNSVTLCFIIRFPKDDTKRKSWAALVPRAEKQEGILWQPALRASLCSKHFFSNDFYFRGHQKFLKPNAVPTIFTFASPVEKLISEEIDKHSPRTPPSQLTVVEGVVESENAFIPVSSPTKKRKRINDRETPETERNITGDISEQTLSSVKCDHPYYASPTKLRKKVDYMTR